MRIFHFSESAFHHVPNEEDYTFVRVSRRTAVMTPRWALTSIIAI